MSHSSLFRRCKILKTTKNTKKTDKSIFLTKKKRTILINFLFSLTQLLEATRSPIMFLTKYNIQAHRKRCAKLRAERKDKEEIYAKFAKAISVD